MNRIVAIILLTCLSFQFVLKLGIVTWYELNKNYVATVLCENRDKPQLKCCGKCFVRKQLAKADMENNGSKQLPVKHIKAEAVDCILPEQASNIAFTYHFYQKVYNGLYISDKGYEPLQSIFHPPSVC